MPQSHVKNERSINFSNSRKIFRVKVIDGAILEETQRIFYDEVILKRHR